MRNETRLEINETLLARNETRGGNNLLLSGMFSADFNITVSKLGLRGAD